MDERDAAAQPIVEKHVCEKGKRLLGGKPATEPVPA